MLLAATLLTGAASAAIAQNAATYDPSQLPATHGKVAEYSLTPNGDVDGLILTDGTEVHLPPHLGTQLVFAVKPGDAVTIHGLRARAIPMVQAMSVTNDATGNTVTDSGAGGAPGPRGAEQTLTAQGRIKAQLHGPQGDLNGALLEDGTIVRLPPPEAQRLAADLTPGAMLYVKARARDRGSVDWPQPDPTRRDRRASATTARSPSAAGWSWHGAPASPRPVKGQANAN
jgi:hypothetical protein